jgi:hypothetical protein
MVPARGLVLGLLPDTFDTLTRFSKNNINAVVGIAADRRHKWPDDSSIQSYVERVRRLLR